MKELKGLTFIFLLGIPVIVMVFVFGMYFLGCESTNSCDGIPQPERTSIPTLVAATLPAPKVGSEVEPLGPKCQISAVEFLGAWVAAGYPETDPFEFTDATGKDCTATFSGDVQRLFIEANLWYDGAPACTTCHYADVQKSTMNLDLSSYAGILAGSGRANGEAQGKDILAGGDWENSLLYQMVYAPNGQSIIGRQVMPLGRPLTAPANGPMLFVGTPVEEEQVAQP